jgi:hypothetical protein
MQSSQLRYSVQVQVRMRRYASASQQSGLGSGVLMLGVDRMRVGKWIEGQGSQMSIFEQNSSSSEILS